MLKFRLGKLERRIKTRTGRPSKAKDDLLIEVVKTPVQIEREKLTAEIKALEARLKKQLEA